jgi:hypothetical protein
VVPLQEHLLLHPVFPEIVLDQFEGIFVPPAEAGTTHTDSYLLPEGCHGLPLIKLIKYYIVY